MRSVSFFSTPQLEKIHSGKVRESFRIDASTRLIVVADRVSCFDKVLQTTIPNKGAILNSLSNAWFAKTQHIIDNHFLRAIDPNMTLVKEAKPIRVEMIVRKYLTGSIWRKYSNGERSFSGVTLPDGMKKNDPFPEPIITPTTKEIVDRPITPEEIVRTGLVEKAVYEQMEAISKELFEFGTDLCKTKNLILVDTKYEFGFLDDKLILIDEIHTPDSSRFWPADAYSKDPASEQWMDKEFIRQYLLQNTVDGKVPDTLPDEVVQEAMRRYRKVYETLLDEELSCDGEDVHCRMYQNLLRSSLIKDGYVAIVLASKRDLEHGKKIKAQLDPYDVMVDMRVVSAHKNGEEIARMVDEYNHSVEPGAVIAVAGRSNGLGGALSANLALPVVNCPPFQDKDDFFININSSLMMPSNAPAATAVDPENAAKMALRCLNIPRLKERFNREIRDVKEDLIDEDSSVREQFREQEKALI